MNKEEQRQTKNIDIKKIAMLQTFLIRYITPLKQRILISSNQNNVTNYSGIET